MSTFLSDPEPTAAVAAEAAEAVAERWGEPMLPCPVCTAPGQYPGKEFVTKVDGTDGVFRDCRACGGTAMVPDVSTGDKRREEAAFWGCVVR